MSGWTIPNRARSAAADEKARRLAEAMTYARSFKDAARKAGLPIRTATRVRARLG